jgi:shikimate dehydrogenase
MIRLAVFGFPIAHSLSPGIHGMFAGQCGLDVDYRAIEARPQEFAAKLDRLISDGGMGCNVTVPLKHSAWNLAKRTSEAANLARAANTLVLEGDSWYAENTDGPGLVNDLVSNLGRAISGSSLCLIGAGGAAAGVLGSLLEQDPGELVIANRTLEKAEQLAGRHAGLAACQAVSLDELGALEAFDLVINATALGHAGRSPELPDSLFTPGGLCYDMNYGSAARPLRDDCSARGIAYQDGLGMLVEQAALSFEIWTGEAPDSGLVLKALRN